MEPYSHQTPIIVLRLLVAALVTLLSAACDEPSVPTVEPPVAVSAQTVASLQTVGAAAKTPEPTPPLPDWVLRYGNDYREQFPTVRKWMRFSDDDRTRQNERLIAFWRAHEAGERSVLHVEYLRGTPGHLFYWRLVTEDGSARLVVLDRQPTITSDAPLGGNAVSWRVLREIALEELRFGRLHWHRDARVRFRARRPPYSSAGGSLGFELWPASPANHSYFRYFPPPFYRAIDSE